jgi:type II secretory pathway pseudopilin PulG
MKVPHPQFAATRAPRSERGYILITLILFVALLAIAMTVIAPVISQQVKRDREEELIHRGVQYSRAIKHFVKKFGRYPTRIEELENTNNIRFLRKRYKDPITGKDFKILHMGEVQMSFGAVAGMQGTSPAANLAAAAQATGFGAGNSAFGNNAFGSGGFGNSAFGNSGGFGVSPGGNAFGGNSFGGNAFGGASNTGPAGSASPSPAQASGTDATQANPGTNPDQGQGAPGTPGAPGQPGQGNQVFGGGPIVGVASISKDKTIRVFNKKEHYYQWQFIYDPSTDSGGLLSTPNQPGLQSLGGGMQQGIPGQPGTQNSPLGVQGSPFGFQGGTQVPPGGMQPGPPQQIPQPQFPPDQAPPQ